MSDVVSVVGPNVKLTGDAVELLEALITDKFLEFSQKTVKNRAKRLLRESWQR